MSSTEERTGHKNITWMRPITRCNKTRLLRLGWPQPCAHVSGPLCLLYRNGEDTLILVRRQPLMAAVGKHGSPPRKKGPLGEDGARDETQRPVDTTMHNPKVRAADLDQTALGPLPDTTPTTG